MKKLSLLICTTLIITGCINEDLDVAPDGDNPTLVSIDDQKTAINSDGEIEFVNFEEMPTFPGGMKAWTEHLKSTVEYPEQAKKLGIEGAVFLSFVVHEDGRVDEVQVRRGIGGGCDEEAVMTLLESPNWVPGKLNGEAVKAKMQVRIVFRLDKNKKADS